MLRFLSRRINTVLHIPPQLSPTLIPPYIPNDKRIEVYPEYNEVKTITSEGDGGYRLLINVCHDTQTIRIDSDMSDYEKLNDLPRFIKTLGCLYPNYTLKK